jgi:crossover junction endodeoxyribonuclease RuvC
VRIFGVDPGLTRCGVGVIDAGAGNRVSLVHVSVLRTPADDDTALRLTTLQRELSLLLTTYQPDVVALERVFAQHNVRTVMGTAQVSGVVMALAGARGIPVVTRTPSEVKAAVTGYGGADKAQVTHMVQRILGLDAPPKPADAADALALAITEAWRGAGTRARVTPGGTGEPTPAQRAWREAEKAARPPKLKQ